MAEGHLVFDLTRGPLLSLCILQLSRAESVLLLTMHHIVADGWSLGVLQRELATLYKLHCGRPSAPPPELPVQYADFAQWQREALRGSILETQLGYWRRQLDALPPMLRLPTDRPRPAEQTFHGRRLEIELPAHLSERLKRYGQRQGGTLFMVLLGAFQLLLSRYSGQNDIVVGSPIANRNRREIENLIGFFANSLVLRTDLSGNPTFQQLLERVRDMTLGAYAHQDIPFEMLVEHLQPTRHLSHNPLLQVVFALQSAPLAPFELYGLDLQPLELDNERWWAGIIAAPLSGLVRVIILIILANIRAGFICLRVLNLSVVIIPTHYPMRRLGLIWNCTCGSVRRGSAAILFITPIYLIIRPYSVCQDVLTHFCRILPTIQNGLFPNCNGTIAMSHALPKRCVRRHIRQKSRRLCSSIPW